MVDSQPRPPDWEEPVRLPDPPDLHRILVPFDGSHSAERALAWALRLAGGAEIVVVVAWEAPLTKKGRGAAYVEQVQRELAAEATELAEEAVALVADRGAACRGVVVRGEPAAAITATVVEEDVDLVVVGRRGLSSEIEGLDGAVERLRSALQGSVADRVVRHSASPVLVVE